MKKKLQWNRTRTNGPICRTTLMACFPQYVHRNGLFFYDISQARMNPQRRIIRIDSSHVAINKGFPVVRMWSLNNPKWIITGPCVNPQQSQKSREDGRKQQELVSLDSSNTTTNYLMPRVCPTTDIGRGSTGPEEASSQQ